MSRIKAQNVTENQRAVHIKGRQIHIYLHSVTKNKVDNVRYNVIV